MQLSYNINPSILPSGGSTSTFGGGSVMPNFTTTNFETQAINIGKQILNAVPFGGLVTGLIDSLGFGPDDWETEVAPKAAPYVQGRIDYATAEILQNKNIPLSQRLTKMDAYISACKYYQDNIYRDHEASNSINLAGLKSSMFDTYLKEFRKINSNNFHQNSVTKDLKFYNFTTPSGKPFTYPYGSVVTYVDYSAKNSNPKTSVKPTSSIPNVATSFTGSSGASNNEVDNQEISKYWYLLLIPFVVYGVVELFKKLKKKKK
ncbi:hypothetical protein [Tenacibaculum soleae]|uniref:hypothetical protein n=1 Tax=Tenacibaculum soleae TaxID=447689 RepID=UPI0023017A0A|nr:hypothetical protein [Tenacibaculum soleae]